MDFSHPCWDLRGALGMFPKVEFNSRCLPAAMTRKLEFEREGKGWLLGGGHGQTPVTAM